MTNDAEIIGRLREKIERVKKERDQKEGAKKALEASIKKDFGVESIDEAYKKLEEAGAQIEVKKERREELLKIAQERLAEYR